MELEHEFSVQAPIDAVWAALTDLGRSAPCMPNTTVDGAAAPDRVAVQVTSSLGPFDVSSRATITLVERDDAAHRAVWSIAAARRDGDRLADATVTIALTQLGERTDATVHSSAEIHGMAAMASEGALERTAQDAITTFAANLEALIAGPPAAV